MSLVRVNGVSLNVEIVGSGPAVVALHGFAGNLSTWSALVEELREEFSFVLLDLLGHGGSEAPAAESRYSLERAAADLFALLDLLRIGRAFWLGYSMGGRLALLVSTIDPNRVAALVLEGASAGLADPAERRERAASDESLARMIEEKGIETFVDYWEETPLFATQKNLPRETRERVRKQRLACDPRGLAATLRAASPGAQPCVEERLRSLGFPVLCVAGELDQKFVAIARRMVEVLPDGRLALIPGAGHCAHLERPGEFCRVVREFLAKASLREGVPKATALRAPPES